MLEYKDGAAEILDQVKAEVKDVYRKLDQKTETAAAALAALEGRVAEKKDIVDITNTVKGVNEEVKALAERADTIDALVAKLNRLQDVPAQAKSLQEILEGNEEFKALASGRTKNFRMDFDSSEFKAITSASNSAGNLIFPERRPGIVENRYRPLTIRDLFVSTPISTNSIEFVRENVFTNNAAPVAEGAQKPESTITFSKETGVVRTLAHFFQASNQVLEDAAGLASMIENRGLLGLDLVEENQLLLGDGTGENLTGVYPLAPVYSATGIPGGTGANGVDRIRWAKLRVRQGFYSADAVVLNPLDWATIELMKDTQGAYLHSAVVSGATPRLWGMRVAESDAIPAGNFLLGSFTLAAEIRDRQATTVDISKEDRDNFIKNMTTIRVEKRLMVNVIRPAAFTKGALAAA